MTTVERLFEEALSLTIDEREELVSKLQLALYGLDPEQVRIWDEEAERRLEAIDAGGPTIPWETVREKMFERIRAAQD